MKKNKKIVSITMVKNEEDIIESFVRYNINFLDKMIFIDNGCVDNTISILRCLKEENLPIAIENASYLGYEQYALENKYMYQLVEENEYDLLIPLDADEFIVFEEAPLEGLNKLSLDCVYYIKWRTYILKKEDDLEEQFIPKRLKHIRDDSIGYGQGKENFTKLIIPLKIVDKYHIVIQPGHHTVHASEQLERRYIDNIKLAHFPIRSERQLESKVYTSIPNNILWEKREGDQSFHWYRMYQELSNGSINAYQMSLEYSLKKETISEIDPIKDVQYHPIDLSVCNNIEIRYGSLIKIDTLKNVVKTSEMTAVSFNIAKINMLKSDKCISKILIYGTGNRAKSAFHNLEQDIFLVLAYIEQDSNKLFEVFQGRLVISPEMIKFIQYDKIVMACTNEIEVRRQLIDIGIESEKIEDLSYLLKRYIDCIT